METSTLNQIIDSIGVVIAPIATVICVSLVYQKLLSIKKINGDKEEALKDILFYRAVIQKYRDKHIEESDLNHSNYKTFRAEVSSELDYKPSRRSDPSSIERELIRLGKLDEKLKAALSKVK